MGRDGLGMILEDLKSMMKQISFLLYYTVRRASLLPASRSTLADPEELVMELYNVWNSKVFGRCGATGSQERFAVIGFQLSTSRLGGQTQEIAPCGDAYKQKGQNATEIRLCHCPVGNEAATLHFVPVTGSQAGEARAAAESNPPGQWHLSHLSKQTDMQTFSKVCGSTNS